MAGTGHSKKEITHDLIVKMASRALRKRGASGIGVAEIMQEAGLTHGGFYAHFKSKNTLVAEAADRAAGESLDGLRKTLRERPDNQDPLRTLLQAYLSERHLNTPERGCMLASLGSDLQRESAEVRRVSTERIKELIDMIQRQLPASGNAADKQRAMATLAGMVGAMIVARAVDEPDLAMAMMSATIESLASATSQT